MATLKNTTITGTDGLTIPRGSSGERPGDPRLNKVVETFTSTGSSTWTCPTGVTEIELLIVGGGGAGSRAHTTNTCGGGGAGGVVYKNSQSVSPGTNYTVTVGAGGTGTTAGGNALGGSGSNSSFVGGSVNLVGLGGGRGAGSQTGGFPNKTSQDGGSGGGAGSYDQAAGNSRPFEGSFATQPTSASGGFGHDGGNVGHTDGNNTGGGGGGGAGGPGSDGLHGTGNTNGVGGSGGPGLAFNITGQTVWYAGGGGGSGWQHSRPGAGGIGGGARGGSNSGQAFGDVTAATANTGGGGGGAKSTTPGNTGGGSGIVVIRYTQPDATDAEDILGAIRYNEDLKELEVYNQDEKWTAQDNTKNWAGHNTLLYSSLIGTSGVTKYAASDTLNTSAAIAPNGKTEATQWNGDGSTSTRHFLGFVPNTYVHDSNTKYTFSIFVKRRGSTRYCTLETRSYGTYTNPGEVIFDLQEGVATNPDSYLLPRIVYYGDGWYRISMTATTNGGGAGSGFYLNYATDSSGTKTGVTLGTADGYFIWGMQDNEGVNPDPYTPITDTPIPAPYSWEDWRIHKYTDTGTSSFVPACTGKVQVLVIAGGGAGGNCQNNGGTPGGGGGAGGLIHVKDFEVTSGETYTVTVGAGAAQNTTANKHGERGENSRFGDLVAYGGGGGGGDNGTSQPWGTDAVNRRRGWVGGSGGGSSRSSYGGVSVLGQGRRGGGNYRDPEILGYTYASHCNGGGGAGTVGGMGFSQGADGGHGLEIDITGDRIYYAGGGAGGGYNGVSPGVGGLGGGGDGASYTGSNGAHAGNGTANTGSGGGGGAANNSNTSYGGAGGSGIVIIRYKVG